VPEELDLRSAFEAAEQAAAAGDYMAAERHLSGAASQQEASLGPLHPDLANTLNNLGVVYETIDRPADAERCYRRAYSIAVASLEPDHPFVATSEKNLRDFCEARGKSFELPTPLPAVVPPPEPAPVPAAAPPELSSEPPRERPVTSASRVRAVGVLGVIVIAALIAARLWLSPNEPVEPAQEVATPPPLERAAPISEPPAAKPIDEPPAKPVPERPAAAPRRVAPRPASTSERPVAVAGNRRTAPPVSAGPTMAEANVCSELSTREWRCNPVSSSADSGQLFFYTRVKSPTDTTVEHRWYHGNRLHRRVGLRVQANQRSGYRTYSRTAVNAGDWRVELRSRDGAVLHEERFVVR